MGTTNGFDNRSIEIPKGLMSNSDFRVFFCLLFEYMGSDEDRQNEILETYPMFADDYELLETKAMDVLKERIERRGGFKKYANKQAGTEGRTKE